jgi:hypothetical protein
MVAQTALDDLGFLETMYDLSDLYNGGRDSAICHNDDCDAGSIGFLCGFEAALWMLVDNPEGLMEAALQYRKWDATNPVGRLNWNDPEFLDAFYAAVAADRERFA